MADCANKRHTKSPSPDIKCLLNDPENFLRNKPVGSQHFIGNDKQGWSKLIKQAEAIYEVRSSPGEGLNIEPAYLLSYKSISIQGDNPSHIDIPKVAGTAKLLFTGELSGCSLIVTDHNNTHYRVYHDSRPLSSVLYTNVVMAADLTDYIRGLEVNPDELLMTVVLSYDTNRKFWKLFAQLLKENNPTQHWRIFRGKASDILPSFFLRWPTDKYLPPPIKDLRAKFRKEMEDLISTINKEVAGKIPWKPYPVPNVPDGSFTRFDPTGVAPIRTNPAVARTQALRKTLADMKDDLNRNKFRMSSNLFVQHNCHAATDQLSLAAAYNQLIQSINGRSSSVDTIYLWALQKNVPL